MNDRRDDVVTEYYASLHAHEWERFAATLSDDVVRVGFRDNEADTCVGRDRYVEYVKSVIGKFENHAMEITTVFYSPDGRSAAAETVESFDAPGVAGITLHCFKKHEIDADGLISRIDQFWKLPPVAPPSWITIEAIEDE